MDFNNNVKINPKTVTDNSGRIKYKVLGLVLIILGSLSISQEASIDSVLNGIPQIISIVAIVLGIVVFFVSVMGLWGTIQRIHCLLVTYAVITGIIMVLDVVVAILAFMYGEKLSSATQRALESLFENYSVDSWCRDLLDQIQISLHCCGLRGSFDWFLVGVPVSCRKNLNCVSLYCSYWPDGCLDKAVSTVQGWYNGIGSVAVVSAFLQLYGIISVIRRIQHMKRQQ